MNGNIQPTTINSEAPQVLQLIYSETERAGDGKSLADPVRCVRQVFTLDGTLLVREDPYSCFTVKDVLAALEHIRLHELDSDGAIRYLRGVQEGQRRNDILRAAMNQQQPL